jgi:hypothetical protein
VRGILNFYLFKYTIGVPLVRTLGTVVRGIRGPMITEGNDIASIAVDCLLNSAREEGYALRNRDILGVTESVVARAQGNYVSLDQVASEARSYSMGNLGIVHPILSRNRFLPILTALARGSDRIILLLRYPQDEVGNPLMNIDEMVESGINPYSDVLTEETYTSRFGGYTHPFTGINYVDLYRKTVEGENCDCSIILANDPRVILEYKSHPLAADIHTRNQTKRFLKVITGEEVWGLDDFCRTSVRGSGYNPDFGLLGSNMSSEGRLKLFPRIRDNKDRRYVEIIQEIIFKETGRIIEVLIFGDGAFKDPVAGIWELADPVVCPDYTDGLIGRPNEIKIKYHLDESRLTGKGAEEYIRKLIREKKRDLLGSMDSQGTTPRRLTDLLGSLCDLTTGSGDKGTPFVLVQGYFDSFAE